MERRHGKRPLVISDEQEEKEEEEQQKLSRFSSARADQDASAMVSALAHVISSSQTAGGIRSGEEGSSVGEEVQATTLPLPPSSLPVGTIVSHHMEPTQPLEDQGMYMLLIYIIR